MRTRILISILLALVILAVYYQVVGFGFVSIDDPTYVTRNPNIRDGLNWSSVKWALTAARSANWHPLTWMSHALDCTLFGLRPAGHHATNLLLHIANTILLFLLLSRMTGFVWRSAFVAAIFAVHPLHVESVTWIAERKDVLSTFLWIITMWAYLQYIERPSWWRYLLVALAFALGLMSKPMLVTLPIVLLLLDFWPLGRWAGYTWRKLIWEKLPLFALAAASSVVTFIVQQRGGAVRTMEQYSLGERAANAVVSYIGYIGKMFWPARLSVMYPHPGDLPIWQVIAAVMALAALTYLAIRSSRNRPYITVGWFWYVITLLPVIGLVQVGEQSMADRYTYIPLIGLFIVIAWGVPEVLKCRTKAMLAIPAVLIILSLSYVAWIQVGYWRNGVTLFRHAVAATSGNYKVRCYLADALCDAGKPNAAIVQIREALRSKPDFGYAHDCLGCILYTQGKIGQAVVQFKQALRLDPKLASAHGNMGSVLDRMGRTDEAITYFRKAIELDPNMASVHTNFGGILYRQGKIDEAIAQFRAATEADPDDASAHYSFGIALMDAQEIDEAEEQLNEAVKLDPSHPEAHFYLAEILMNRRRLDEALDHLERAVEIKPDWGVAHYRLAILLAAQEDYARAWAELDMAVKHGCKPDPRFVRELSQMMPKPAK